MKKLITFLIVLCFLPILSHASYLDKTRLEANLHQKAQHILDTMYGENNFSAIVIVDIGRESWAVNYTDQADIEYKDKKGLPSEDYNILPGYSAIKNLSPNEAVQMPFNSKITKFEAPIIKITIDIVASKDITKPDIKKTNKLLTEILDLDIERGDAINFIYEEFPIVAKKKAELEMGMPTELKIMIFVLIITSLFFIVYIILQIKQLNMRKLGLKASKEAAKAASARSKQIEQPKAEDVSKDTTSGGQGDKEDLGYFSFVTNTNVAQFINVVTKKELSTDQLAIILSYVKPSVSKSVINTYDREKQLEIIEAMIAEKVEDTQTIDALEKELKTEMECTVGGVNKLEPLIAAFDDSSKKEFLGKLESNTEIYNKIRPNILLFDDIEKIEDTEVKRLIGELDLEVLAASVATDDSEASKKIIHNLTGSAKAMVTQFIDLKKASLTDDDVTYAKNEVVRQLKYLSDIGKVDIVSKLVN